MIKNIVDNMIYVYRKNKRRFENLFFLFSTFLSLHKICIALGMKFHPSNSINAGDHMFLNQQVFVATHVITFFAFISTHIIYALLDMFSRRQKFRRLRGRNLTMRFHRLTCFPSNGSWFRTEGGKRERNPQKG